MRLHSVYFESPVSPVYHFCCTESWHFPGWLLTEMAYIPTSKPAWQPQKHRFISAGPGWYLSDLLQFNEKKALLFRKLCSLQKYPSVLDTKKQIKTKELIVCIQINQSCQTLLLPAEVHALKFYNIDSKFQRPSADVALVVWIIGKSRSCKLHSDVGTHPW